MKLLWGRGGGLAEKSARTMGSGEESQLKLALAGLITVLKLAAGGGSWVVKWILDTPSTWDRNCNCPRLNPHNRQVGSVSPGTCLAGIGVGRSVCTTGSCGLVCEVHLDLVNGE